MNLQMSRHEQLRSVIQSRAATVGICGLGYVGLPLAIAAARAGFNLIGFDVDQHKIDQLKSGQSYVGTISAAAVSETLANFRFDVTLDFGRLTECDVIVMCVPTPLTRNREPDLSFVEQTTIAIAKRLHSSQLIILESTTYPGTTSEVVRPILEQGGLVAGRDFFIGFSPEREDPGNIEYRTTTIPKIVSGDGPIAKDLVVAFYACIVEKVVAVSSTDTAEAVKITENVFRAVNIALVNELKLIYDQMGIDVWEVIEAAKTKPFGYMAFYPGPGLGGHCIPIDPFYLTWKSRENGVPTRFIELAGEINTAMPQHVVGRLEEALDLHLSKTLSKSRVLILGIAYKKNVSDTRESPALKLIELLERRGAHVSFHDPHVSEIPMTREYPSFAGRRSIPLDANTVGDHDAVLIVTDHDGVDYSLLENARLVVDTRNVCFKKGLVLDHVVKA